MKHHKIVELHFVIEDFMDNYEEEMKRRFVIQNLMVANIHMMGWRKHLFERFRC